MKTNRVRLCISESVYYQWEFNVPENIDSTDGAAVCEWAEDNDLLDLEDHGDVVNQQVHTEKLS